MVGGDALLRSGQGGGDHRRWVFEPPLGALVHWEDGARSFENP
jgi:hypothetical protein